MGDVLSNDGNHQPMAVPCLDALTRAWAHVAITPPGFCTSCPTWATTGWLTSAQAARRDELAHLNVADVVGDPHGLLLTVRTSKTWLRHRGRPLPQARRAPAR